MRMIYKGYQAYEPYPNYGVASEILIVFNGTTGDFYSGIQGIKEIVASVNFRGFPNVVGISEMSEIHSLMGKEFSLIFKTDSCDFWVWAKCVELFVKPHIPPKVESQEEVELGEIVPCQFPEFDMKNV